jgi:hypothetical protein
MLPIKCVNLPHFDQLIHDEDEDEDELQLGNTARQYNEF